jgi:hypothetical protein
VFSTRRSQASHRSALVRRVADPVDSRIRSNSLVHRVNHDDFVVLVHGILVQPIRVQDSQRAASSRRSLFRNRLQVSRKLQLSDTAVHRLTVDDTLANRAFAATSSHARSVNHKALLSLVPQSSSLVRSRRSRHAADGWKLSVFPNANTLQKSQHVGLFLLPEFFYVFVSLYIAKENSSKR